MSVLRVHLFGKFNDRRSEQTLEGLHADQVQELFCYLLLYRDRPYSCETLAALLWGDCSTGQSKEYLRQTLWQLQLALHSSAQPLHSRILVVEPDSVCLDSEAELRLGVAVFEKAFAPVHCVPGEQLDVHRAQALQSAVPVADCILSVIQPQRLARAA